MLSIDFKCTALTFTLKPSQYWLLQCCQKTLIIGSRLPENIRPETGSPKPNLLGPTLSQTQYQEWTLLVAMYLLGVYRIFE